MQPENQRIAALKSSACIQIIDAVNHLCNVSNVEQPLTFQQLLKVISDNEAVFNGVLTEQLTSIGLDMDSSPFNC